jgi:hypothetical protein
LKIVLVGGMTPILLIPPVRREEFEGCQFFDALNHRTSMDAGDAGNGGIGGKTCAGCLIQVHFNRAVDGVAIHADLRHIGNDRIFNAGVGGGFQGGNGCHWQALPLL